MTRETFIHVQISPHSIELLSLSALCACTIGGISESILDFFLTAWSEGASGFVIHSAEVPLVKKSGLAH